MSMSSVIPFEEIRARGSIRSGDVAHLRQAMQDDPTVTDEDAEALLELEAHCAIKISAWSPFFIETLADYLVNQVKPEGYIAAEKAVWLKERITCDGLIESSTALELLTAVIERARWSPPSLVRLALDQVRRAVTTGVGPLRSGQTLESGAISQAEIDLLIRMLSAFGKSGIPITRAEADILIDINQSIVADKNSQAWTRFYVAAVSNAMLAGLGFAVPSRQAALTADAGADARSSCRSTAHVPALTEDAGLAAQSSSLFGRTLAGGAGRIWASCRRQSSEERALARLERQRLEIITNEPMEEADEGWFIARLAQFGTINSNDRALLSFVAHEANELPPGLAEFVAKVARAA